MHDTPSPKLPIAASGFPDLFRLKKVGTVWSARVGLHYRALGEDHPDGILWYWIGSHAAYDHIT